MSRKPRTKEPEIDRLNRRLEYGVKTWGPKYIRLMIEGAPEFPYIAHHFAHQYDKTLLRLAYLEAKAEGRGVAEALTPADLSRRADDVLIREFIRHSVVEKARDKIQSAAALGLLQSVSAAAREAVRLSKRAPASEGAPV